MHLYRRVALSLMAVAGCVMAQNPAPNSVQNPASNILPGLPNFGIAQGSIFVVYGSNLGPAAISVAPSLPLPAALSGTSIQVTAGGTTVTAPMVYTLNTQIAAVLPSNTPTGSGTLTVKYNGGSGSTPITVVKSNFGISTVNQSGTGPAVVTFGDYSVVSGSRSAKAGDTLILWGTGLGPISGDDAAAPTPADLGTPVTVYVGGAQARVVYRGRSAEPGLDQINFVVPTGVTGCAVSVVVQTGNLVSNTTTMAIASDNGACSDPSGISVSAFTPVLSSKGTVSVGLIDLFQDSIAVKIGGQSTTTNTGFGSAVFDKYTADQIGSITGLLGQGSLGSCTVTSYGSNLNSGSSGSTPELTPVPSVIGLDAGAAITVTPPSEAPIVLKPTSLTVSSNKQKGDYSGQVSAIPAGAYTISNGSGGADIGAFTKTLTLASPVQWTNQTTVAAAPIDRTKSLTLTWTGGDPSTYAFIEGSSTGVTATAGYGATFICTAPIGPGQFTIPSPVLLALPPTDTQSLSSFGFLVMGSISNPVQFTAPGLDFGYVLVGGASGGSVSYQ